MHLTKNNGTITASCQHLLIISRPVQIQGFLYKHRCHQLTRSVSESSFPSPMAPLRPKGVRLCFPPSNRLFDRVILVDLVQG